MANRFTALLYGASKSGKNVSISTLLKAGQKVRLLAADPNAEVGIRMGFKHHKLSAEQIANFAAVNLTLGSTGESDKALKNLKATTSSALRVTADAISKQMADPNKKDKTQLLKIVDAMESFKGSDGTDYGKITEWSNDTTLVFDGLTVLCRAAETTIVGDQLAKSQPNYQALQNLVKQYILTLTNLSCNFVMLAHDDQLKDDTDGKMKIFPLSAGPSLSNWIPGNFGELIYSQRKVDKFVWCTRHQQAVCGGQLLQPLSDDLPQDFTPIVKALAELDKPLF